MLEMILTLGDALGTAVFDAVGGIIGWFVGFLASFVLFVAAALPANPFDIGQFVQNHINWQTGMMWLNWFVPVGTIEVIMVAWVAATLAYFASRYVFKFIYQLMQRGAKV